MMSETLPELGRRDVTFLRILSTFFSPFLPLAALDESRRLFSKLALVGLNALTKAQTVRMSAARAAMRMTVNTIIPLFSVPDFVSPAGRRVRFLISALSLYRSQADAGYLTRQAARINLFDTAFCS